MKLNDPFPKLLRAPKPEPKALSPYAAPENPEQQKSKPLRPRWNSVQGEPGPRRRKRGLTCDAPLGLKN